MMYPSNTFHRLKFFLANFPFLFFLYLTLQPLYSFAHEVPYGVDPDETLIFEFRKTAIDATNSPYPVTISGVPPDMENIHYIDGFPNWNDGADLTPIPYAMPSDTWDTYLSNSAFETRSEPIPELPAPYNNLKTFHQGFINLRELWGQDYLSEAVYYTEQLRIENIAPVQKMIDKLRSSYNYTGNIRVVIHAQFPHHAIMQSESAVSHLNSIYSNNIPSSGSSTVSAHYTPIIAGGVSAKIRFTNEHFYYPDLTYPQFQYIDFHKTSAESSMKLGTTPVDILVYVHTEETPVRALGGRYGFRVKLHAADPRYIKVDDNYNIQLSAEQIEAGNISYRLSPLGNDTYTPTEITPSQIVKAGELFNGALVSSTFVNEEGNREARGRLVLDGQDIIYITKPGFTGSDTFYYYVYTSVVESSFGRFGTFHTSPSVTNAPYVKRTISINIVDTSPPVLSTPSVTLNVERDEILSSTIGFYFSDAHDDITYEVVTSPTHGNLQTFRTESGEFRYNPPSSLSITSDSFSVRANDGGTEDLSTLPVLTVNITILDPSDNTEENTLQEQHVAVDVINVTPSNGVTQTLADYFPNPEGEQLIYTLVDAPDHGSVDGFNRYTGEFIYTPDADIDTSIGADSIVIRVDDGNSTSEESSTITVNFFITEPPVATDTDGDGDIDTDDTPPPLPEPEATYSDSEVVLNIIEGQNFSGNFNNYFRDPTGNPPIYRITTSPNAGNINGFSASNGSFTYTPLSTSLAGAKDSFAIKVQIGDTPSSDDPTITVQITIISINEPIEDNEPVETSSTELIVHGNSITADINNDQTLTGSLDNIYTDPEGDDVTYEIISAPSNGSLTTFDSETGTFTYTPDSNLSTDVNSDEFQIRVTDGNTPIDQAEILTITVEIAEPYIPPSVTPTLPTIPSNLSTHPAEFQNHQAKTNIMLLLDDSSSMLLDFIQINNMGNQIIFRNYPSEYGDFDSTEHLAADRIETVFSNQLYQFPGSISLPLAPMASQNAIIPMPQAVIDANPDLFINNRYGTWRLWHHKFNGLYYNPKVQYKPWPGYEAFTPDNVPLSMNILNTSLENDSRFRLNLLTSGNESNYTAFIPLTDDSGEIYTWNGSFHIPFYYKITNENNLIRGNNTPLHTLCANLTLNSSGNYSNEHCELVEIKSSRSTYVNGSKTRFDCAREDHIPSNCTYEEEIKNFTNWFTFHRTRLSAAKSSIALAVSEITDARIGYAGINQTQTRLNSPLAKGNNLDRFFQLHSNGQTPVSKALFQSGRYFSCRTNNLFPDNNSCFLDTLEDAACQNFHTVLITDGFRYGDYGYFPHNTDGNNNTIFDGGKFADSYEDTIADVSMHFYERDLHTQIPNRVPTRTIDRNSTSNPDFENRVFMHQHMKTHIIGFGIPNIDADAPDIPSDATASYNWPNPCLECPMQDRLKDYLHASINGRGEFLHIGDTEKLSIKMVQLFRNISETSSDIAMNGLLLSKDYYSDSIHAFRTYFNPYNFTGDLTAHTFDPDTLELSDALWSAKRKLGRPHNKYRYSHRNVISMSRAFPTLSSNINPDTIPNSEKRNQNQGIYFKFRRLDNRHKIDLPSPSIVEYLRGAPVNGLRKRDYLLGGIIHAEPRYVGPPQPRPHQDDAPYSTLSSYSDFVTMKANREPVVFVPSNDGMLHSFSAETGKEYFAYIPNKFIDGSQEYRFSLADTANPSYVHKINLDITPTVADVLRRISHNNRNIAWRTTLVGSLGLGGKGIYALDVDSPQPGTVSSTIVLWEFTDEDDFYPTTSHGEFLYGAEFAKKDQLDRPIKSLGYILHAPRIALSNIRPNYRNSLHGNLWGVYFGNGIDSTSGIATLYFLPLSKSGIVSGWDRSDIIKISTDVGSFNGKSNALGAPVLIDHDGNGTADLIYAGDLRGNLYRFDLRSRLKSSWHADKIFTATDKHGKPQPITARPYAVRHPDGGYVIVFGTGKLYEKEDSSDTSIQSIYGIWDNPDVEGRHPLRATSRSRSLLVKQTITNTVIHTEEEVQNNPDLFGEAISYRTFSNRSVNYQWGATATSNGVYGWYVDLDMPANRASQTPQFPGERAIKELQYVNDSLITTTVIPQEATPCLPPTALGAILHFDPISGAQPIPLVEEVAEVEESEVIEMDEDEVTESEAEVAVPTFSRLYGNNKGTGGLGNIAVVDDIIYLTASNEETIETIAFKFQQHTPGERVSGRTSWRILIGE